MKKLRKHRITKEFVDLFNNRDIGLSETITTKLYISKDDYYYGDYAQYEKADGSYYMLEVDVDGLKKEKYNGIYKYTSEYIEEINLYIIRFNTKHKSMEVTNIAIDFDVHKIVNRERVINSLV